MLILKLLRQQVWVAFKEKMENRFAAWVVIVEIENLHLGWEIFWKIRCFPNGGKKRPQHFNQEIHEMMVR